MEKQVFIADYNTILGKEIASVFAEGGYTITKTTNNETPLTISKEQQPIDLEENQKLPSKIAITPLNWNPISPFSAKNILLQLKHSIEPEQIIIIFSFPGAILDSEKNKRGTTHTANIDIDKQEKENALFTNPLPLFALEQTELQKSLDYYLRGPLNLTKELIFAFPKSRFFLVLDRGEESFCPYTSFFKTFIDTLLTDTITSSMEITAYKKNKENPAVFAKFLYTTASQIKKTAKNRGKWIGKLSFYCFCNQIA